MTIKRGVPTPPILLPNATAAVYAVPTGVTRVVITSVSMYANVATTGVEMFIDPNGGTATITTQTLKKNFALDETFLAPELIGKALLAGGTIQANDGGNGGTDVNFILTVTEFSGDS